MTPAYIPGRISGDPLTPDQRAKALRDHRRNDGVRALLQMIEDATATAQGTAQNAATVAAGMSPYYNGSAAGLNDVLDEVAKIIES